MTGSCLQYEQGLGGFTESLGARIGRERSTSSWADFFAGRLSMVTYKMDLLKRGVSEEIRAIFSARGPGGGR